MTKGSKIKGQFEIRIGQIKIGSDHPPFIIAEMSGNHNQSLERALALVDAAAEAGAHGLKIQTYTADTMTLDLKEGDFAIDDPDSLWYGKNLYQLYQEAHTPWDWHQPILERCKEHGMVGFSTPFDFSAVDFLETLSVPLYKIASFENIDLPLIKRVAETGKTILISTGMANLSELDEMVKTIRSTGNEKVVLLKCTSSYPATPDGINLRTIPHLRDLFEVEVGLSDHSLGIGVSLAAVALGATVIEKHFTLSRSDDGVDSAFSLEPDELRALVVESKRAWQALGKISYGVSEKEKNSIKYRRSLYITKDLKAGDVLDKESLRSIRPGYGLPPKYYETLLGRKVARDVKIGTPASWELLG